MKRKILSLSLAIIMAVMPFTAFAEEIDNKTSTERDAEQTAHQKKIMIKLQM